MCLETLGVQIFNASLFKTSLTHKSTWLKSVKVMPQWCSMPRSSLESSYVMSHVLYIENPDTLTWHLDIYTCIVSSVIPWQYAAQHNQIINYYFSHPHHFHIKSRASLWHLKYFEIMKSRPRLIMYDWWALEMFASKIESEELILNFNNRSLVTWIKVGVCGMRRMWKLIPYSNFSKHNTLLACPYYHIFSYAWWSELFMFLKLMEERNRIDRYFRYS